MLENDNETTSEEMGW